jgi:hypothetical protein
MNALAKATKPLLSWCCGSGNCGSRFIDWDEDEVKHKPVRNPGYDSIAARMDVGLSMLVPLKEWSVPQGILVLLSALAAILNRIVEYVVPTEREFGVGRPAVVAVSAPLQSIGVRLGRVYPVRRSAGGQVWRQARSTLPTTRSFFRSRSSG